MGFKTVQSSFAKPWRPTLKGDKDDKGKALPLSEDLRHEKGVIIEKHKVDDCPYLVGIYAGSEEVPPQGKQLKGFTSYRLRATEGPHKGETMGFSSAFLASVMNQVPKGAPIRVTYGGLDHDKKKTGMNAPKLLLVEVDEDAELVDPDGLEMPADSSVPF